MSESRGQEGVTLINKMLEIISSVYIIKFLFHFTKIIIYSHFFKVYKIKYKHVLEY